jgi:antitoxin component HigA of HigAB toxin-antitoxin module
MEIQMSDSELLKAIMQKYGWNQTQLAEQLLCEQPQVSLIINEKRKLRMAVRRKAETLLKQPVSEVGS